MERKTSLRAKARLRSVETSRRLLRQSLFLEKYTACGDNSELWLSMRDTFKKGHRGSTTKCFSHYHIHTGKAWNLNPRQTLADSARKSSCHSQFLDMCLKFISGEKNVCRTMQFVMCSSLTSTHKLIFKLSFATDFKHTVHSLMWWVV